MKIIERLKNWNSIFCRGMTCKANIKRDIAVVLFTAFLAAGFLYFNFFAVKPPLQEKTASLAGRSDESAVVLGEEKVAEAVLAEAVLTEEEITEETEALAVRIGTSGWKTFSNQFWGFKVKYPGDWLAPAAGKKTNASQWEARYQFRKKDSGEDAYLGFDVAVYDIPKTKELRNTEEYPAIKSEELKSNSACQNIRGHALEIDEFPAEEIYIAPSDECFQPALFFTIVKERYIYNIVPVARAGLAKNNDPRISINESFPEYYAAASTLDLVEIVRPKPAPPKPKITAPKPVSFKVVGGKLVCAKKNDKPRKSRQNKGKHLDMECCLDPDEYPNPWCTY